MKFGISKRESIGIVVLLALLSRLYYQLHYQKGVIIPSGVLEQKTSSVVAFFQERIKQTGVLEIVRHKQQAVAPPPVDAKPNPVDQYSRITFFHRHEYIASIAVPQDWEGRYQTDETDKELSFYYATNKQGRVLVFKMAANTDKEWSLYKSANSAAIELKRVPGYVFSYVEGADQSEKVINREEYLGIKKSLPGILATFKIRKQ
jgi:hypothetical protein